MYSMEPEDFLLLHMREIIDEEIPEDNIPTLLIELRNRVKDLQEGLVKKEDIEIIWKKGAYIGKYVAELCDYWEALYYKKEK